MEAPKIIATGLFRTRNVWRLLDTAVLPNLPAPTVWCGATGTGEEAWTAALVAEKHGGIVIGTDVHVGNLSTALAATYPVDAVKHNVPQQYWERFTEDGSQATLTDDIRSLVTFGIHNLEHGAFECDLAIIRNVWRHLSPAGVQALALSLAESLTAGGRLVIGGADLFSMDVPDRTPEGIAEYMITQEETALLDPVRELFEQAEHPYIWRLK